MPISSLTSTAPRQGLVIFATARGAGARVQNRDGKESRKIVFHIASKSQK